MQVCKYARMQVYKYASMQVYNVGMHINKLASMQVCKYARMQVYASMNSCKCVITKYVSMQLLNFASLEVC